MVRGGLRRLVRGELGSKSGRGVVGVDVRTVTGLRGGGDTDVSGAWGGTA